MKKHLVYIAPSRSSFVLQDIEHLSEHYLVRAHFFRGNPKGLVPFELIKLFWLLLWIRPQAVLVSFGGYHSFVAALMSKWKRVPCFIILNGTDCAAIPEYNYGHLRGGLLRWCCLKSYQWATQLLPVSDSLLHTENAYAFSPEKTLGLKTCLEPRFVKVIPNGFDPEFWQPIGQKVPNTFITVSGTSGWQLKGLDLFCGLAKNRPDATFKIAGIDRLENCPTNVQCLGYLSKEELRLAFSRSEYFLQLSIWEGFGCALCEAMLCGCMPVVSDVNMLAEIAGKHGLVLKKREKDALIHLFETQQRPIDTSAIRASIIERFPIDCRIHQLIKTIG